VTTVRIISLVVVALASRQATAEPAHRPAARLGVTWDASHLDLEGHVLRFKVARPARSADLVAIGEDGDEIGTGSATYSDEPVTSWLPITWTQKPDTRVMMPPAAKATRAASSPARSPRPARPPIPPSRPGWTRS
jgi:hypothetical protein